MNEEILCVITNWRRPHTILKIVEALRVQTVPVRIAIVECSPGTHFALPADVLALADVAFTIDHAIGPLARLMPLLMLPEHEYTYYAPDDMIPGPLALEWMRNTAVSLRGEFAAVGQQGRVVVDGHPSPPIKMEAVKHVPVDYIVGGELFKTKWAKRLLSVRDNLIDTFGKAAELYEHDVFVGLGLQMILRQIMETPCPCVLTSQPPNELYFARRHHGRSCGHALSQRGDNLVRKCRAIEQFTEIGWESAVTRNCL